MQKKNGSSAQGVMRKIVKDILITRSFMCFGLILTENIVLLALEGIKFCACLTFVLLNNFISESK